MIVMTDRELIIDTVNRLFIFTDNREWPKVKALFTPLVYFDMTSLAGGLPTTISSEQIVNGWDKGLKGLKAIHHQAGNYLVDIQGNDASLFCYGAAWHYLPNKTNKNSRIFVGSYDIHLVKQDKEWKIDRFKFNLKFIDGNLDLENS